MCHIISIDNYGKEGPLYTVVEEAEFYSSKHNSVGIVWKTTCTGCKILLVNVCVDVYAWLE